MEHFVAGTPARTAAELVGVNRNTARLFYHRLREIIARQLARSNPPADEIDGGEAGLEGTLSRENHRARAGRTPVFGLLRRGGRIHTVMTPAAADGSSPAPKATLRADAIVYVHAPDIPEVLDVAALRHERTAARTGAARGRARINSIENFWGQAKRQLQRYGGIPRRHFHLFLKECEWRFNYGSPRNLQKTLKQWIKAGSR